MAQNLYFMEDNFSGGRPFHIFADGDYAGKKLEEALTNVGGPAIEIFKRADDAKGFVLAARRWVAEQKLAWVKRYWRHVKDLDATIASSEAWFIIASIL
jgi:transposase